MTSKSTWRANVLKKFEKWPAPKANQQPLGLKKGAALFSKLPKPASKKEALIEQPFDLHLLHLSQLYRKSRSLYTKIGGTFLPSLTSSPRTLSTDLLLGSEIQYSPIQSQWLWAAVHQPESLIDLRGYCVSVFHEQNHRILWAGLPAAPKKIQNLHLYLNFSESLVITLDSALSDELGPSIAPFFHLVGITYDPGSAVRSELNHPRHYRNYLQALLHATFLNLEHYRFEDTKKVIHALFPQLGSYALRATQRAYRLDTKFVTRTNPLWQNRHSRAAYSILCSGKQPALEISTDPMDVTQSYVIAEKVFSALGL